MRFRHRVERVALIAAFLCLLLPGALALQLARELPLSAAQGDVVRVTLSASDLTAGQQLLVGETIPAQASLIDWSVDGAREPRNLITFTQVENTLVWEFSAQGTDANITYSLALPDSGETAAFDAVFAAEPDLIGNEKSVLALLSVTGAVAQQPASLLPEQPVVTEQPAPVPARRASFWNIMSLALLAGALVFGVLAWRNYQRPREQEPSAQETPLTGDSQDQEG
jgi:hypothetical protein